MDTSAVQSQTPEESLLEYTRLFIETSKAFQDAREHSSEYPKIIMHTPVAYELGAYFNKIMALLITLDGSFASRNREKPAPAPLVWYKENSYEKRLIKVIYGDEAYARLTIPGHTDTRAYILLGIDRVIAASKKSKEGQAGGTRLRKRANSRRN